VTVLISAHSGGREAAPSASFEAYQHAVTSGAEYAEMDIRRTADGVLVIHHDERAGPHGPPLASLSYDGLCARSGQQVPTAADVMGLLAGQLLGHLDLKETGYEREVIDLALATFGAGNFVATTLEDVSVRAIKDAFPDVLAALSLGRDLGGLPPWRWPEVRHSELFPLPRIRACGADWVAVQHRLARAGVARRCRRQGVGVMVWTVDADGLIDQFLTGPDVDVLITNRPAHAAARRAELAAG
jgi:glycerophosphoryl diester phosphodiesterase